MMKLIYAKRKKRQEFPSTLPERKWLENTMMIHCRKFWKYSEYRFQETWTPWESDWQAIIFCRFKRKGHTRVKYVGTINWWQVFRAYCYKKTSCFEVLQGKSHFSPMFKEIKTLLFQRPFLNVLTRLNQQLR